MLDEAEELFPVSLRDGDDPVFDSDVSLFDGVYLVERNHIRLMHPADDVRRYLSLEFGEGLERQQATVGGVNLEIIAHPFDEDYFPQHNFFQTIFDFDEEEAVRRDPLSARQVAPHAVNRLNEPLKREGLEKVVGDLQVKSLQGILLISRRENDLTVDGGGFEQLNPRDFAQVDVQKDEVNFIRPQKGEGVERIVEGSK